MKSAGVARNGSFFENLKEKGILQRAFAQILPEDVRTRKKSAYPTAQHPAYDKATREWALHILNEPNAPIRPLLDMQIARARVESENVERPGMALVSLAERIIQMNAWLEKYQVELVL